MSDFGIDVIRTIVSMTIILHLYKIARFCYNWFVEDPKERIIHSGSETSENETESSEEEEKSEKSEKSETSERGSTFVEMLEITDSAGIRTIPVRFLTGDDAHSSYDFDTVECRILEGTVYVTGGSISDQTAVSMHLAQSIGMQRI